MRRLSLPLAVLAAALLVACSPKESVSSPTLTPEPDVTPTLDALTVEVDGGQEDISDGGGAEVSDVAALQDTTDVADAEECLSNEAFFEAKIWGPIFSIGCVGCHNPAGLAKSTDMVFELGDTPGALAHNFAVAEAIALETYQGVPLLLLKPSNQHPDGHAGGEIAPAGSTTFATLEAWVKRVQSTDPCADEQANADVCESIAPGPPMLRLLNRAEYDRTIADLFGFPSSWGAGLTPENVLHGFDNQAEALTVPALLAEQLRDSAEAIATQAMGDLDTLLPCDPEADGEEACRDAFITAFGKRAFRRPMTALEVERYGELHSLTALDDGFSGGVEAVVAAVLQSPHFLYRRELGVAQEDGTYALTPYEVASFLSYFLWGTMPDAELFDRADDGTLTEDAVLAAQADRLLADPRSEHSVERFASQWLGIDRLMNIPKDEVSYPEFGEDERAGMIHQSMARFQKVVGDEEGTFADLLLGQEVIIDSNLAEFYGLPSPETSSDASGFGQVDTSATPYGGLLTDGGLLTSHAFANGSSPIHRGKFVREQLFCQELPPPPPGIVAEPPAMDPNATTRERFSAHAEFDECAGCHRLIDPIGFALEHFDGVGRYREDENGLTIDASGEIIGTATSDATFDGPEELALLLSESEETKRCFAQQWLRYGYGMEVSASMKCLLDDVAETFASEGHQIRALLRALAISPHATMRADPVVLELEPEVPGDLESGDVADGGSTDTDAQSSDDADSGSDVGPVPQELSVDVTQESSWGAGHCDKVTVTNDGAVGVSWSVELDVGGVITQAWETTYILGEETWVTFKGAAWNQTLAPGESTSFGYCADTTIPTVVDPGGGEGGASPDDLSVNIEIYTEWGTGYCANGSVTNDGEAATTWGFSWPVEGEIYNIWEATATPMGDQVYFTGVASNASLAPGATASFGFCANL